MRLASSETKQQYIACLRFALQFWTKQFCMVSPTRRACAQPQINFNLDAIVMSNHPWWMEIEQFSNTYQTQQTLSILILIRQLLIFGEYSIRNFAIFGIRMDLLKQGFASTFHVLKICICFICTDGRQQTQAQLQMTMILYSYSFPFGRITTYSPLNNALAAYTRTYQLRFACRAELRCFE